MPTIYRWKSKLGFIVSLTILLIVGNLLFVQNVKAFPVLPSSFYGIVKVDEVNIEPGTKIRALINDQVFAEGPVQMYEGNSVYTITVPGDDSDTNVLDGGREGERIVFVIGNILADQTGEWRSGTNVEFNLSGSSSNQIDDLDIKNTLTQSPTLEQPEVIQPTQAIQEATQGAAQGEEPLNPNLTATYQPTTLPLIDLKTPEVSSNTMMDAALQSPEEQSNTQPSSEVSVGNQPGSQSNTSTRTKFIFGGLGFVLIAVLAIWAWTRWR